MASPKLTVHLAITPAEAVIFVAALEHAATQVARGDDTRSTLLVLADRIEGAVPAKAGAS